MSSKRRLLILPNPWPPDTIDALLIAAATVSGLAPVAYKLIALWVEDRKARKVHIKCGDRELELQGGVSDKEVERAFSKFSRLTKDGDEVEVIILPRNLNRSIPFELASGSHEEQTPPEKKSGEKRAKKGGKKSAKKGGKKKGPRDPEGKSWFHN